jgi:hypothetical protein
MGTGEATPYPYPSSQILPLTHTYTRQWVQLFPIHVTRQGKWVPAGKIHAFITHQIKQKLS